MKKYYYVRDRRVDVDEIEGVVAVRIAVDAMGALRATASSYGTSAQAELEGSESEEVRESLGAFERANWVFVKPSAEFSRTLSARDRRADTEESGKFRAPDIRRELSLLCRRLCRLQHQPEVGVGVVDVQLVEHAAEGG